MSMEIRAQSTTLSLNTRRWALTVEVEKTILGATLRSELLTRHENGAYRVRR
jgi:hypothetical protein